MYSSIEIRQQEQAGHGGLIVVRAWFDQSARAV
jgi:hypothetical protein